METSLQTGFAGFNLPASILNTLAKINFTSPTPVQEQTIPLALEGNDILASAQTGTGKTGAFGIPLIANLLNNPLASALILTPTRELATQVHAALRSMMPNGVMRSALLIGGEAMGRQFRQLEANPRLVVGTPGRVNDHLQRGSLNLENAAFLVLDETDRMLDMGFGVQLEAIMQYMPQERQSLLFSATLPKAIIKLAQKYQKNPVRVAVGITSSVATNIQQEHIKTSTHDKYPHLLEQLEKREGSVIIFVKTKHGTEKLAEKLNNASIRADAIHGDLQQRRRERVIQNFRDKRYRVLVATDVAARGLDIPHIEHVINYDLPQCAEDYIHRIGRTARAGAEGSALNLISPEDSAKWRAITRLLDGKDDSEENHSQQQRKGRGSNRSGNSGSSSYQGNKNGKRFGASRNGNRYNNEEKVAAPFQQPANYNKPERSERSERSERFDRPERSERSERFERNETTAQRAPQERRRKEGDFNRTESSFRKEGEFSKPRSNKSFGKKPFSSDTKRSEPRQENATGTSFSKNASFKKAAPYKGDAGAPAPYKGKTFGKPAAGEKPFHKTGGKPFGRRPITERVAAAAAAGTNNRPAKRKEWKAV